MRGLKRNQVLKEESGEKLGKKRLVKNERILRKIKEEEKHEKENAVKQ